ncbi:MAG: hypothetical protein ABW046_13225 [Actinoplanes sp.]
MPQKTILRYAAPALAAAFLLGGCAEPKSEPRVATLQSNAPSASPSADADNRRPLVRLDATDEERDALWKVWGACVTKEGGPGYENPRVIFLKQKQQDPKADVVAAACLEKQPETYEERQKRTDLVLFRDNQRQWYQCAKKAGYKVTAADENGEFGITEVGPNGDFQSPKMEKCRRDAFSD